MSAAKKKSAGDAYKFVGYSIKKENGKKSLHLHVSAQSDKYAVFMPLPSEQSFHWFALPNGTKTKEAAIKFLASKKVPSDVKKFLAEKAANLSDA
jgi:hypothetical protein